MRKRNFRARVWLNEQEYRQFIKNVEKTGLSKETYLRQLINDYQVKASPPIKYHELIHQLLAIGYTLNQIAAKLNTLETFNETEYSAKHSALMKVILAIQQQIEMPSH